MIDGPIGILLLVLVVGSWFCSRTCAARWDHPDPEEKHAARMMLYLESAVIVLTLAGVAMVKPALYGNMVFLVLSLSWLGVFGVWVYKINGQAPTPAAPARPSFGDRLLVNAGLLGVILPALLMASGLSTALTWPLGWKRFLGPLRGAHSNPSLSIPSADMPTVDECIQRIFAGHLLLSLYISVAWVALATLHAWVIWWWQGRRTAIRGGTAAHDNQQGSSAVSL
jgi:hypothetical protein